MIEGGQVGKKGRWRMEDGGEYEERDVEDKFVLGWVYLGESSPGGFYFY